MSEHERHFYQSYISNSFEYKQLRFIQSFLEYILDNVICDIINECPDEIYCFSEWVVKNYPNYLEYDYSELWFNWVDFNYTPRIPSKKLRQQVLDRFNYTCQNCGSHNELQIDHIIPYSNGGKTVFNNLTVLCGKCNRDKSNKEQCDV